MSHPEGSSVTELLHRWRDGDERALGELFPIVYDELRRIAGRYMRSEREGHTLQATALVHEAFVRLVKMKVEWQDRVHFKSVAAGAMRRILVDRARARASGRRGRAAAKVTLGEDLLASHPRQPMLIDLDDAMTRLASIDARKSRAIELKHFGGLTHEEIAALLDVSVPTVVRDLKQAKAWLYKELS
jgi:RNA polymerase sigma factor (TIGR02999 family)